jgi:hypothetical protein
MKAREYRHHRTISRLIVLDVAIMGACMAAVLISGGMTYYAVISRIFGAITGALPH